MHYRINDNKAIVQGIHQRLWCCQSLEHKKPSKQSKNPNAKPRENDGMDRFNCNGQLNIRVIPHIRDERWFITDISITHEIGHVPYIDVSIPTNALEYIKKQAHSNPALIAADLVKEYPQITRPQVYTAWSRHSEQYWKKSDDPILSVTEFLKGLPKKVDFWDLEVPEGVVAVAWGCRKVGEAIGSRLVEVALDATCEFTSQSDSYNANFQVDNTNEANLELYSMVGEIDNAGYPVAYCLLSTATSISLGKRTAALSAFLQRIKVTYKVNPSFTHVDKDFAEIAALGKTWPDAKVQLCWWHLSRAVSQRMAKRSLRTSAYDAKAAHQEYDFIPTTFCPTSRPDRADDEGYGNRSDDDDYNPKQAYKKASKKARLKVISSTQPAPSAPPGQNPNALPIKIVIPISFTQSRTQKTYPSAQISASDGSDTESDVEETGGKREFCPFENRDAVISLMERHYCAHPSIPGYARPERLAIRYWAVKEMFIFCQRHKLQELWAYLWCNWYRSERWELWARSSCSQIPRLKTTMICESQ